MHFLEEHSLMSVFKHEKRAISCSSKEFPIQWVRSLKAVPFLQRRYSLEEFSDFKAAKTEKSMLEVKTRRDR